MMYDIILVEKPYEEGIQPDELALLFAYLNNDFEYYPISIEGDSSYAYGYATGHAIERIPPKEEDFQRPFKKVLNDMELETSNHAYDFHGLSSWMGRDITELIEM